MTDLSENVSACEFLFSVRKMLAPLICNISNIFELLIKMKRLHRMVITQQGYSINLHQGWTMCGLIVHCCSKTMLHSFDNSIIFVYSYYIDVKIWYDYICHTYIFLNKNQSSFYIFNYCESCVFMYRRSQIVVYIYNIWLFSFRVV